MKFQTAKSWCGYSDVAGDLGSPLVKEDIERYILGHGKKGSHAGYGKHWFETLKRAAEIIPNPLATVYGHGDV